MTIAGCLGAGGSADATAHMLAALSLGGGRKPRLWREAGVTLGWCDDADCAQGGPSPIVAVLEGRIDNGADLVRALDLTDAAPAEQSGAGLVRAAFERWGADCLDRIHGDFACAIWDGAARRLLLGREAIGRRPLHYRQVPGLLLFASEPRGLLALPEIPRLLDEQWLAERMALLPMQDSSTVYQGIKRVPPGHVLIVDGPDVRGPEARLHRHWRPEELPLLSLRRDADYAEAVRAALETAIAARLPSTGLVCSQLSAGLDSPSVTALAARQLAAQNRRLTAFTAVPRPGSFDASRHPGRICDEGALAATIARDYPNIDHVLIPNQSGGLFAAMDRYNHGVDRPVPNVGNLVWCGAIHDEARRRGAKVMLVANGGNMTVSHDGLPLLGLLARQGSLLALAQVMLATHRVSGRSWLGLLHRAFGSFLPGKLRNRIVLAFGRQPGMSLDGYSGINPDFARETGIAQYIERNGASLYHAAGGDGRAIRLAAILRNDRGMFWAGARRAFGIDMRDPTLDRRVVDLCLSIPEAQFLRHGEERSLIRRAMAGILSPEILAERRKGLQAADWPEILTAARAEILQEIERLEASPLAQRYVDVAQLRRLAEDWPTGGWHRPEVVAKYHLVLGRGLSAGRFVRGFESGNC